ncbi:hypothetical protein FFI89_033665 [Bradyrhizobium sp. KBS0727]|nr:hypothetical protein FFI71_033670 [Bradyrhizobium sp. KBS0725]QDW48245.1 hypothetical protein FFI89_033665 [Bradyrhizobium sp. KBS0727]
MTHSTSFRGARSANPESRDSPMRNCASEVWSFGPSRNDSGAPTPPPHSSLARRHSRRDHRSVRP